jgi:hypothetical protein
MYPSIAMRQFDAVSHRLRRPGLPRAPCRRCDKETTVVVIEETQALAPAPQPRVQAHAGAAIWLNTEHWLARQRAGVVDRAWVLNPAKS